MIVLYLKNIPVFNSFYISVITCTLPTVSNASPNPASPIEYNTSVTYTCQPGYEHTDGDLTRTCQANGSLTGSLPECTSKLQKWFCRTLFNCCHFNTVDICLFSTVIKNTNLCSLFENVQGT